MELHCHLLPENTKCIVFFNGWGMDSHAIKHVNNNNFDIYEIHNYTNLTVPIIDFSKYSHTYLVAWSMGVWAAHIIYKAFNHTFTKKIAINGTGLPIHETLGIAPTIFQGTLASWTDTTRTKFNMRMFGGRTEYQTTAPAHSQRSAEHQKQELQAIYITVCEQESLPEITWDCAIIGEHDNIFTAENQKNYWQDKTKCFTLPIPHYPFMRFHTWEEIIRFGE